MYYIITYFIISLYIFISMLHSNDWKCFGIEFPIIMFFSLFWPLVIIFFIGYGVGAIIIKFVEKLEFFIKKN